MSKTKLISPGIPNYTLKRNLQLNDKYLSNDGDDEGMRIANDGKVGIGELAPSSPSGTLHIKTKESVSAHCNLVLDTENASRNANIQFYNAGSSEALFRWDGNNNQFEWFVGSDQWMTLDSSGNLGIGTAAPSSLLDVQGGLTTTGAVLTLSTKEPSVVANDVLGRINFQAPLDTGADSDLVGASIHALATDTFSDTVNATDLIFSTGASETAAEKVRITSAGRVGIDQASPGSELDINGYVRIGKGTNTSTMIVFRPTDYFPVIGADGTGFFLDSRSAGRDLHFMIDNSTKMTLDTSGQLGIGTASPGTALHVVGDGMTFESANSTYPLVVIKNTTNDTTGPTLKLTNDAAGTNSNILGNILFSGKDIDSNAQDYAKITSGIVDRVDGDEKGDLSLLVTTASAGLSGEEFRSGLTLTGQSTNSTVNALIGSGTTSVTTIAGDVSINGDEITVASELEIDAGGDVMVTGQDFSISQTKGFYLDGNSPSLPGDTYIVSPSTDYVRYYVGGDMLISMTESGDDGNNTLFNDSSVTFARKEATFSATGVIGTGGTDDTDIDFRFSNKYRLEMTGDITNVNLIFPAGSGNFTLVCTTNGDHDVTNWRVYEDDETAATTASVMWPGGTVPTFTNNGIDIVSFYWDGTEQQCYGVASLAFATP